MLELDKARDYVNETIQSLIVSILHGMGVAPELSALPGPGQQGAAQMQSFNVGDWTTASRRPPGSASELRVEDL